MAAQSNAEETIWLTGNSSSDSLCWTVCRGIAAFLHVLQFDSVAARIYSEFIIYQLNFPPSPVWYEWLLSDVICRPQSLSERHFSFFHTAHCCTAVEDWSAFPAGGETGGCPGWWLASLFRPSYFFPVSLQQHRGLGREKECFLLLLFESLSFTVLNGVCATFDLKVWGVLNKHVSNILWHHRTFGSLIMVQWTSESSVH